MLVFSIDVQLGRGGLNLGASLHFDGEVFTGDVAMSMQIWRCGFCGVNSQKKHTFVKNSASDGFDFDKKSASGGFDFDKNSASCC